MCGGTNVTCTVHTGQGSNCQFGVPLEQCPKNSSVGYDGAVPAVLVLLAKQLLAAGGITTQGVFRKVGAAR